MQLHSLNKNLVNMHILRISVLFIPMCLLKCTNYGRMMLDSKLSMVKIITQTIFLWMCYWKYTKYQIIFSANQPKHRKIYCPFWQLYVIFFMWIEDVSSVMGYRLSCLGTGNRCSQNFCDMFEKKPYLAFLICAQCKWVDACLVSKRSARIVSHCGFSIIKTF